VLQQGLPAAGCAMVEISLESYLVLDIADAFRNIGNRTHQTRPRTLQPERGRRSEKVGRFFEM
jgi:hypothetical protein